jgi:hypothetical protein
MLAIMTKERPPAPAIPTASPAASLDALLVDDFLPRFDVTLAAHQIVEAPPGPAWEALRALDLVRVHSPIIDASFWVRSLPARLRGSPPPAEPPPIVLGAEGEVLPGWLRLGEHPGRELALGAIGRFWTPSIEWREVPRAEFRDFAEAGWGKIAVSFSLRPYGVTRSLVSYECRTATNDDASRRAFARYWSLIRPFVAHLMRATLATLQADVAAARQPTSTPDA